MFTAVWYLSCNSLFPPLPRFLLPPSHFVSPQSVLSLHLLLPIPYEPFPWKNCFSLFPTPYGISCLPFIPSESSTSSVYFVYKLSAFTVFCYPLRKAWEVLKLKKHIHPFIFLLQIASHFRILFVIPVNQRYPKACRIILKKPKLNNKNIYSKMSKMCEKQIL
jgi:hypothetical protein